MPLSVFPTDRELREWFIKYSQTPAHSVIQDHMGVQMTKVFYETLALPVRPFLKLDEPLQGPTGDLWQSPSDLLIGKIRLKPPFSIKCVQALMHEGIMEVGAQFEHRLIQRLKLQNDEETTAKIHFFQCIAAKEKELAVYKALASQKIEFDDVLTELKQDFTKELNILLKRMYVNMKDNQTRALEKLTLQLNICWRRKLILAVRYTVSVMTQKFAKEMQLMSEEMYENFQLFLCEQYEKYAELFRSQKLQYEGEVEKLQKEMNCENVANIMQVMIAERRRCIAQQKRAEKLYNEEIARLKSFTLEAQDRITQLSTQVEQKDEKIASKSLALLEIVKEFQKFIYYALQAVPTQAEYLLDVEQLMLLALSKSMAVKKKPCRPSSSDSASETTDSLKYDDVLRTVAPDFHDCDNETEYHSSAHTLDSVQDLPGFVFDDNTYLRQDFRNMLSQGLRLTKSHELWSQEIEDMTQVFNEKKTTFDDRIRFAKSTNNVTCDREHSDGTASPKSGPTSLVVIKPQASWQKSFDLSKVFKEKYPDSVYDQSTVLEATLGSHSLPKVDDQSDFESEKCIKITLPVESGRSIPQKSTVGRSVSRIITSRDSLELTRERLPDRARPSIIKQKIMRRSLELPLDIIIKTDDDDVAYVDLPKIGIRDSTMVTKKRLEDKDMIKLPDSDPKLDERISIDVGVLNPNFFPQHRSEHKLVPLDSLLLAQKQMRSRSANTIVSEFEPGYYRSRVEDDWKDFGKRQESLRAIRLSKSSKPNVFKPTLSREMDKLEIPQKQKPSIRDTTISEYLITSKHTHLLSVTVSTKSDLEEPAKGPRKSIQLPLPGDCDHKQLKNIYKKGAASTASSVEMDPSYFRQLIKQPEKQPSKAQSHESRKSVAISHVEMIPPDNVRSVAFNPADPKVIEWEQQEKERVIAFDARPTKSMMKHENFLLKPNEVQVVGDPTYCVEITPEEFSRNRLQSLEGIFKKHPSLCNMFVM